MQLLAKCTLPIPLPSESNLREHWTKKHKRHKDKKDAVFLMFSGSTRDYIKGLGLPILVKLIRRSQRKLDSDNLISAFKSIRDAIADVLNPGYAPGRADNIDGLYWDYDQEISKEASVEIEFYKPST